MSYAPGTLKDLRIFLADAYDVPKENFSIRGVVSAKRNEGYHLGESDIYGPGGAGAEDYSLRYRRDRRGLTNASAGFDLKIPKLKLKALTAYLVKQAKNGYSLAGKSLIVEVIGPDANGVAKRWARDTQWSPTAAGDSHEWHTHVGFYRDTEFIDKRPLFAKHLGVDLSVAIEVDQELTE